MAKKPAAAFRGGLYDGLSSLTGVGQSSSTAAAPGQSVTASPSQEAKPTPAAPAAGWSSDGVTSSFLNAINMRKKAAAHHAPGALKPKALTAPPKAAISTGAASSSSMAVDNTPEEEVHDRYDPLKPNEFDHYVAQKNRRNDPVREDSARREEPPRKVQATGPVSIFAEKFVFPKKSPISQFPTPVLLLLNMAGAGNFDPQLESDTSSECSRFGRVVRCVVKVYPGAIEDEVTRIFVRFADVASAERAFKNLDGRFFDGRKVRAAYYDERAFEVEFA